MSKLKIGGVMLTIPYHFIAPNGADYFQMQVPASLVSRVGKKLIKLKLNPKDGSVHHQCKKYAEFYRAEFQQLKANAQRVFEDDLHLRTLALLNKYGLKEGDGAGPDGLGDPGIELEFGFDYMHRQMDGDLTPEFENAVRLLKGEQRPKTLSNVLDVYLEGDHRGGKFEQNIRRLFRLLIETVGDVPMLALGREQANMFRDARDKAVTAGSVNRELNSLRAAFNHAIEEWELTVPNPFLKIKSKQKSTAQKKHVFTHEQMQALFDAARASNDDIRTVALIMMATGARIGEVTKLRLQDIDLYGAIPTMTVTEFGADTVKTRSSLRTVPLVSWAVEAIREQLGRVGDTSLALFPRYSTAGVERTKADSCSAAVNKWIRATLDMETVGSHSWRHTLKDLMRNASIPKDRRDEVLGHRRQDVGDTYGDGTALEWKLADLNKSLAFLKTA